jgi:hypothetical protein
LLEEGSSCECPPASAQSDKDAFPESTELAKGETRSGRSMNDPLSYH